MMSWVLVTVFVAGVAAENPSRSFADKSACELQAVAYNLRNSQSYQKCMPGNGGIASVDGFLRPEPRAIALAPPQAVAARPVNADTTGGNAAAGLLVSGSGTEVAQADPAACTGMELPSWPRRPPSPGGQCDPGERINKTTAADARAGFTAAGYSRVIDLRKGCDNYWHAAARRGVCYVGVVLSPQGQVSQETN